MEENEITHTRLCCLKTVRLCLPLNGVFTMFAQVVVMFLLIFGQWKNKCHRLDFRVALFGIQHSFAQTIVSQVSAACIMCMI